MNEDKNSMTKLTTEYAKLLYSVFIEFRLSAGLTPSNKTAKVIKIQWPNGAIWRIIIPKTLQISLQNQVQSRFAKTRFAES